MDVEKRRRTARIWLTVLIAMLMAGGIARVCQQITKAEWLEGFVAIFGGFYIALFGWPLLFVKPIDPHKRVKTVLGWLAGVPLAVIGLSLSAMGMWSVIQALR